MMDKKVVEVKGLTKIYRLYGKPSDRVKEIFSLTRKKYHTDHVALDNVSFSLKKGETLGIIGKNGAGKSTLLKLITEVTIPTAGKIKVDGEVSALLELGTGFNPEYTGYENIFLNGSMRGFPENEMREKLDFIVDFADIGEYMKQPVKTYSSGMFARLAFAVMVSFKPDVLIVDEALSVGDVFFQQKCNTYMKDEMRNVTKILVTHDMNSIANMADRVILLDRGKIVQEGKPLDVIQNYLKIMHTEVFSEEKIKSKETKEESYFNNNDSDTDGWILVKDDNIGGAGDIIIDACKVLVDGVVGKIVKCGDKIAIYVKISSKICAENIILGYTFKDKYGNSIFAQNTLGENIYIREVKDKKYEMKLEFRWPEIKEGNYFLTIGIGEGTDQMVHKIQCWAHNIWHVESIALKPMHGIINHSIDAFEILCIGS